MEASPTNRLAVRKTISERLVTNLDLVGASPRRRHVRDAAHVDVSQDFGQPQLPSARIRAVQSDRSPHASPQKRALAEELLAQLTAASTPGSARSVSQDFGQPQLPSARIRAVQSDRTPQASPQKRPLAEEFLAQLTATPVASTSTPATARSVLSTPGSGGGQRLGFGAAGFGSPSSRRSLAELELLVAEAGAEVQSLELQISGSSGSLRSASGQDPWGRYVGPSGHYAMAGLPDVARCANSVAGQLKSLAARARALEPDVLPSERIQLAMLRTAIAEMQLRYERCLSTLSPPVPELGSVALSSPDHSPKSQKDNLDGFRPLVRFKGEETAEEVAAWASSPKTTSEPLWPPPSDSEEQWQTSPGASSPAKEVLPPDSKEPTSRPESCSADGALHEAQHSDSKEQASTEHTSEASAGPPKEVQPAGKDAPSSEGAAPKPEPAKSSQRSKPSVAEEAQRLDMKAQMQDLRQRLEQAETELRARKALEVELQSTKDALEEAKQKLKALSEAQECTEAGRVEEGGPAEAD